MAILAEQWRKQNDLNQKYRQIKEELKQYIQSGHLDEARELIEQHNEALQFDVEYSYWLGEYYSKIGKNTEAIQVLLRGVSQVPYNLKLHYSLWNLYKKERQYIEASKHYLQAYEIALREESSESKKFTLETLKNLINDEVEDENLRTAIFAKLSEMVKAFYEAVEKGNPKIFPSLDDEEKKTCIGDFYHYSNKKYYVGYYGNCMHTQQPEKSRMINRCEIFNADLRKYIRGGMSGETTLVPIAAIEKETSLSIQEEDKTYESKPSFYYQYDYYKFKGKYKVKSNHNIVVGAPIVLKKDETKKDLVLSLFIDGLSYEFIEKEGIEEVMPHTARYFKDGCICSEVYSGSEWTLPSIATVCTGQNTIHHKIYHPNRSNVLSPETKTMFELFKENGYTTGKIDGNWRITPAYGYIRGVDRFLYSPAVYHMNANEVIGEAIAHLETFKETNQYLWLGLMDLHKVADGYPAGSIFEQAQVSGELKTDYEQQKEKSVNQSFDAGKKERYKQALKQLDLYLGGLYYYLETHFDKNKIVVTLFSDHGQGYLIESGEEFFERERVRVPLMIKGDKQGKCDEKIQLTDYLAILMKSCQIQVEDMEKRESKLPKYFGGTTQREYTYTESIFPGKTYKAFIKDSKYQIYFETKELVNYDGTIPLREYRIKIVDECTNCEIKDESIEAYYLKVIQSHIKEQLVN